MSIFFNKKLALGKAVKRSVSAVLALCCAAVMTLAVSAASNNEIKLETNGSEAVLELYFPQAAAEETASMQISLSINANSDRINAEFVPDSGLAAKIAESRYQSGTGVLNIYLAGTEALFPADGYLTLGRVKITGGDGRETTAAVEIVKDSVRFVRGGELVSPDGDIDYPASVNISASDQSQPNVPGETAPDYPNYPSYPNYPTYIPGAVPSVTEPVTFPAGTDDILNDEDILPDVSSRNDIIDPDTADTVGENLNPPDTSALLEALSRADDYRKSDYTESSYADLNEAIGNANELLSDPNASQDEIDEALLDIENAIGMLTLRNDIPSGAEGYGENNMDGSGNNFDLGVVGGESGEASVPGQGGHSSDSVDNNGGQDIEQAEHNPDGASGSDLPLVNSQSSESGDGFELWVVIAIIAVIAAAAVIVVMKLKNKAADGKHFKK